MVDTTEAERFSKLILSYILLILGILFFLGIMNTSSNSFIYDFIEPVAEWIALSNIWYTIGMGAQIIIENFWPLLLIYYGAHWVLKFEKAPGKA